MRNRAGVQQKWQKHQHDRINTTGETAAWKNNGQASWEKCKSSEKNNVTVTDMSFIGLPNRTKTTTKID